MKTVLMWLGAIQALFIMGIVSAIAMDWSGFWDTIKGGEHKHSKGKVIKVLPLGGEGNTAFDPHPIQVRAWQSCKWCKETYMVERFETEAEFRARQEA